MSFGATGSGGKLTRRRPYPASIYWPTSGFTAARPGKRLKWRSAAAAPKPARSPYTDRTSRSYPRSWPGSAGPPTPQTADIAEGLQLEKPVKPGIFGRPG